MTFDAKNYVNLLGHYGGKKRIAKRPNDPSRWRTTKRPSGWRAR